MGARAQLWGSWVSRAAPGGGLRWGTISQRNTGWVFRGFDTRGWGCKDDISSQGGGAACTCPGSETSRLGGLCVHLLNLCLIWEFWGSSWRGMAPQASCMAHFSLEGKWGQVGPGNACPSKLLEWLAEARRAWGLREQDLTVGAGPHCRSRTSLQEQNLTVEARPPGPSFPHHDAGRTKTCTGNNHSGPWWGPTTCRCVRA